MVSGEAARMESMSKTLALQSSLTTIHLISISMITFIPMERLRQMKTKTTRFTGTEASNSLDSNSLE
jgi:esterase/lipase superfamily enzyme